MGDCDKGFIVEIAGTDHPDLPAIGRNNVCLEIYSAVDGSLLPWTDVRKEGEGKSPRTYYMADLGPKPAEKKYYLSLLLPDGTLRAISPPMPVQEKLAETGDGKTIANEPLWLRPTGCRDMDLEFQDIVFIPFRPMTMIPVMGNAGCAASSVLSTARALYINEAWFQKLRCLREGYLYIFHQGKLWREMQVGKDGSFREIPLFTEVANGGAIQRQNRDNWGKNIRVANVTSRYEEVWIPAQLEKEKVVAGDYAVAFSQHQWEWSYIEWLQEHWDMAGQDRFQSLQGLWNIYSSGKTNSASGCVRFNDISGKYRVAQRAPLQNDAFLNHNTVVNPQLWTQQSSPFGLYEENPNCKADADLWTAFTGINAKKEEYTTPNPLQPVYNGQEIAHNRGIFVVEDPLYTASFYATKANSALTILDCLNAQIRNDEVVGPANHVLYLEQYAYQTEEIAYIVSLFLGDKFKKIPPEKPSRAIHHIYTTLGKSLNKSYISTTARLRLRAILRTYIYAAQEQLALLIDPSKGLSPISGLPGRHIERKYGSLLNASLRDLFMRNSMKDYLEGFAWMHSVVDGLGRSALESDLMDPKLSILHGTDVQSATRNVASKLDKLGDLNWLDEAYTTRIGPTALASWHTFFPGDKEKVIPGLLHMLCPDLEEMNIKKELPTNCPIDQDYGFFRAGDVQQALTDEYAPRLAGLASRLYQCQLDQLLSPTGTVSIADSLPSAMGHAANLMRLAANLPFMVMVDADELEQRDLFPLILSSEETAGDSPVKPLYIKNTDRLYRDLDKGTSISLYQGKVKGAVPVFLAMDTSSIKLEEVWSTPVSIAKKLPIDKTDVGKAVLKGAATWVDFLKLEVSCRNAQSLMHAMATREMTSSECYARAIKLAEQLGRIVESTFTLAATLGEIYLFYSGGRMVGTVLSSAHPALEGLRRVARFAGVLATAIGLLSVEVKARNAWRQGDYLSSILYCLSPFAVTASTAAGSAAGPVGGVAGLLLGSEIAKALEEWAFRWQRYPKIADPLSVCHYGVNAAKPKSGVECRDVIKALYSPLVLLVDIIAEGKAQPTTSTWEPGSDFPLELKEKACNFALTVWEDRQKLREKFNGFWSEDSIGSQIAVIVWSLFSSPAVAGQFVPSQTALHKIIYHDSEPMIAVLQPRIREYVIEGDFVYRDEKLMPFKEISVMGLMAKAHATASIYYTYP